MNALIFFHEKSFHSSFYKYSKSTSQEELFLFFSTSDERKKKVRREECNVWDTMKEGSNEAIRFQVYVAVVVGRKKRKKKKWRRKKRHWDVLNEIHLFIFCLSPISLSFIPTDCIV